VVRSNTHLGSGVPVAPIQNMIPVRIIAIKKTARPTRCDFVIDEVVVVMISPG